MQRLHADVGASNSWEHAVKVYCHWTQHEGTFYIILEFIKLSKPTFIEDMCLSRRMLRFFSQTKAATLVFVETFSHQFSSLCFDVTDSYKLHNYATPGFIYFFYSGRKQKGKSVGVNTSGWSGRVTVAANWFISTDHWRCLRKTDNPQLPPTPTVSMTGSSQTSALIISVTKCF